MTVAYIHRFLTSWGFTIFVETAVLFFLLIFVFKRKDISPKQILAAGIFGSFATIPYVWFVFPYLTTWSRNTSLYFSEPFVFIVEAIFYKIFLKTNYKTALILSFVANLASYMLGPFLRAHGLWINW